MGAFLTGLAAAALLFAVTWITLETYTVTTTERYATPAVIVHGEDRGESWQ